MANENIAFRKTCELQKNFIEDIKTLWNVNIWSSLFLSITTKEENNLTKSFIKRILKVFLVLYPFREIGIILNRYFGYSFLKIWISSSEDFSVKNFAEYFLEILFILEVRLSCKNVALNNIFAKDFFYSIKSIFWKNDYYLWCRKYILEIKVTSLM